MAISKLQLVEIEFAETMSDEVLSKLVDSEKFHPEPASKFVDSVRGLKIMNKDNPYADLLGRMDEAAEKYGININTSEKPQIINIVEADDYFCECLDEANKISRVKNELQVMIDENNQAKKYLKYMKDLDIDFDDLFSSEYIQVRFGKLPTMNLDKLSYYDSQEFLFKSIYQDAKTCYCFYITSPSNAPEIDNIFSSLFFERIHIPEFLHGTPGESLEIIEEENATAEASVKKCDGKLRDLFSKKEKDLSIIYASCQELNKTSEAQRYVVVFGNNAAIYGFCDKHYAHSLKEELEQMDKVHVEIKPAMGDSRLYPPTKLKNNWFSRPFKMFVEMYGVPSYTDFDPTNFVAVTYTFLFGMMFADVGQGILLSIIGFLAYKLKGMKLGEVGMRIGISSAIFGVIFGSVFGSEEILVPFFAPMASENTMTLLGVAIGVGVCLIIISILFNIYLNLKKKHWGELLFSQNGAAGLVFYVAVLVLAMNMLLNLGLNIPMGIYVAIFIIAPLVMIFLKEPLTYKLEGKKMFPHGFGNFFTESFFEMIEVLLTFVANTMSFLRVGGFVLSHAGMMLVVYTLAEMVGGFGYIIVLIIGNAFVMCLEGLIVGIQVLRLEFYELFSRYYEGNGKPFVSMKESLE
ncbi:V-type ATP synthase subunit I [Catenibacterium mitsuokai]|uniref:V-type ATP synthase subunit I n=1 Tax=Catenibacterium mitsuokai TaxID=100886 RepID=UPI003F8BD4CC